MVRDQGWVLLVDLQGLLGLWSLGFKAYRFWGPVLLVEL